VKRLEQGALDAPQYYPKYSCALTGLGKESPGFAGASSCVTKENA
jgi:hypothetical protein